MKNDVTIMRVIICLITTPLSLSLSHLLFSSRLVPFTLILNPNCLSLSLSLSLIALFSLVHIYIHSYTIVHSLHHFLQYHNIALLDIFISLSLQRFIVRFLILHVSLYELPFVKTCIYIHDMRF